MADDSAPENANQDAEMQTLRDRIRFLETRHEKLVQLLLNPTEQMMLAGALAHNAHLRPLKQSITAGEAKIIFAAMIEAMKKV
jgi:hypothetical protein